MLPDVAALGNTLVPVITDTGRHRQAQAGTGRYCRLRHNILQCKGPAHPFHYYHHLTAVSTSTGLSVVRSHHHPQVPVPAGTQSGSGTTTCVEYNLPLSLSLPDRRLRLASDDEALYMWLRAVTSTLEREEDRERDPMLCRQLEQTGEGKRLHTGVGAIVSLRLR